MTDYSYSQLEGLWINAGGPRDLAPTAAAIAEAESGGNSDAKNPSGASGLWQILGNPFPGNPFDPATNARMAVAKWKEAPGGGDNFSPWVTYTDGTYRAYINNSTTPDANVPGSPSAQTTAAIAGGMSDCLVPNPLSISVPVVGSIGGPACLFSKSNARAFIGAGFLVWGGVMALAGVAVLAVAAGMRAVPPLGKAAELTGGALMLVPGAEGAGAALAAGGRAARSPAKEGKARAGSRETANRRRLGEPRERKSMEPRGGTVRQTPEQRSAGRRREQGAARARARRAASSSASGPASREETGF